jgi:hypothetical protein
VIPWFRVGETMLFLERLVLVASLAVIASCGDAGRTRCQGDTDVTTCGASESCVWMNDGSASAYFCVTTCSGGAACPAGESCRSGAASSCSTCQDLIDICE